MRLATALMITLCCTLAAWAGQATYVRVRLPHNVSLDLPRNWTVLRDSQRITLDATNIAMLHGVVEVDLTSDLAFASNYFDELGKTAAALNIRYYPDSDITQAEVKALGEAELKQFDKLMRPELEKGVVASGSRIEQWQGTSRKDITGAVALVTSYRRGGPTGRFQVTLVRVLDGSKSFTITTSYRTDQAQMLRPITQYIVQSISR